MYSVSKNCNMETFLKQYYVSEIVTKSSKCLSRSVTSLRSGHIMISALLSLLDSERCQVAFEDFSCCIFLLMHAEPGAMMSTQISSRFKRYFDEFCPAQHQ